MNEITDVQPYSNSATQDQIQNMLKVLDANRSIARQQLIPLLCPMTAYTYFDHQHYIQLCEQTAHLHTNRGSKIINLTTPISPKCKTVFLTTSVICGDLTCACFTMH